MATTDDELKFVTANHEEGVNFKSFETSKKKEDLCENSSFSLLRQMAQAKNSSNNYEYKINKDELNELTSSERKLLADIEKKVAEYTVQKANIDKQYQTKLNFCQVLCNNVINIFPNIYLFVHR